MPELRVARKKRLPGAQHFLLDLVPYLYGSRELVSLTANKEPNIYAIDKDGKDLYLKASKLWLTR